MKMLTTQQDVVYSLNLREILTAYRLYINGKIVAENGKVGKSRQEMTPNYIPITTAFKSDSTVTELVLQVSNYYHREGGPFNEIELGFDQQIFIKKQKAIAFDLFLFGVLFIMAIYHFVLYVLRRKDLSTLFFGLYALIISVRTLSTSEQFLSVLFPNMAWEMSYRFDYLSFYCASPVFLAFLYVLFPREVRRSVVFFLTAVSILFSLTVFIFPVRIYSHFVGFYQILIIFVLIYVAYCLINSIYRKREGAVILLLGAIVFFSTAINDILYVQSLVKTFDMAPIGVCVFIFSQSYVISLRFSKAYKKNEELTEELNFRNVNLEKIVQERTSIIQLQKENIEAAYNNIELLSEIGKQITSTLSIETITHYVYDSVNLLIDATEFGIGIYNERTKEIVYSNYILNFKKLPVLVVPVTNLNRLSVHCFLNRKEIIIGDMQNEYKNYIENLDAYKDGDLLNSVMCLPLIAGDKTLGIISVQSPDTNVYNEFQINVFRNIAVYTSIAIQNASSYREIEEKQNEIAEINAELWQKNEEIMVQHEQLIELIATLGTVRTKWHDTCKSANIGIYKFELYKLLTI